MRRRAINFAASYSMKWKTVPNCLLTAFLLITAAKVKGIPVFGSQKDDWSLGAFMGNNGGKHGTPLPFGHTIVTHLPVLPTTPPLPNQLNNKARNRRPRGSSTKRPPEPQARPPPKRVKVAGTWIPPSASSASEETEKYFPDLLELLRQPQGSTTKRPLWKRNKVPQTRAPPTSASEETQQYFPELLLLLREPQGSTTIRPLKRIKVAGTWIPPPDGGPNLNRISIASTTPVPSAPSASEETEKYFPDLLRMLRQPQRSTKRPSSKRNEVPRTRTLPPYGGPNLNPRGVRMAPPKTTTVPPWRIPLTRRPPPRYDPQISRRSGVLQYLLSYG